MGTSLIMGTSLVASAIRSLPTNKALVQDLAKAVKVDEETVAIMAGSGWGLNLPQFNSIEAINNHGYTGDGAMALAFYAGHLKGIYDTRRSFEPEDVVGLYQI